MLYTACAATSPPQSLLFSPAGHSLSNSLGPDSSCWLMTVRCLVAMVPLSSLGFALQLSREPQVLAQLSYTELTAPEIPIQRLSFMKHKAADQEQDSVPQGTPDCQPPKLAVAAVPSRKCCREKDGNSTNGKSSAAWQSAGKKLSCSSHWDQSRECKQPSIHKEVITSEPGFPSSSPSCLISKSCSVY